MRSALTIIIATLFTAQSAYAISCDYSGVISFGKQQIKSHECWDLSSWPADAAGQFCSMMGVADDGEDAAFKVEGYTAKVVSTCPSGHVARCEGAQFAPAGGGADYADLPDDYYEQFPPEMRAEIRANAEAASADMKEVSAPFKGLKAIVHYYKDTSGFIKLADQKADCEQVKKGVFKQ